MGGNSRAVDRVTGDVVVFKGRHAYAEPVDLRQVDIDAFRFEVESALMSLDWKFHLLKTRSLWERPIREHFLGSVTHVWDSEFVSRFVELKPTLGDLDIAVSHNDLDDLFAVLQTLEGVKLTEHVTYVGQNRLRLRKPQINAVFAWRDRFVQVDFVGVPFVEGKLDSFDTFARSSPKEDLEAGLKGVAHKYLLMTLSWVATHRDDIVILTDKSPLPPHKVRLKTMHEPARVCSFSIDRGFRRRIKFCYDFDRTLVRVGKKVAAKEIPTSESDYLTDIKLIFLKIFNVQPQGNDLQDFHSFVGLVRLCKRYLSPAATQSALEQMIRYKLFGPGQALSRDSAAEDAKTKAKIIEVARKEFPALASYDAEIQKLSNKYYARYHEREVVE